MSPADRKVVHDTVNEIDGVETSSEGANRRDTWSFSLPTDVSRGFMKTGLPGAGDTRTRVARTLNPPPLSGSTSGWLGGPGRSL